MPEKDQFWVIFAFSSDIVPPQALPFYCKKKKTHSGGMTTMTNNYSQSAFRNAHILIWTQEIKNVGLFLGWEILWHNKLSDFDEEHQFLSTQRKL